MFDQLDYVYMPSRDVADDLVYFTDVLGGRCIFAIDSMGTRVAMIELTDGPPRLLLAGHVGDLDQASRDMRDRGWKDGHGLEIPQGPVRSFVAPGGQRLAIYQLTRPGVEASFAGRREF